MGTKCRTNKWSIHFINFCKVHLIYALTPSMQVCCTQLLSAIIHFSHDINSLKEFSFTPKILFSIFNRQYIKNTHVELPFFGRNVSSSWGGGGPVFACWRFKMYFSIKLKFIFRIFTRLTLTIFWSEMFN
jgi:hypothetical protein